MRACPVVRCCVHLLSSTLRGVFLQPECVNRERNRTPSFMSLACLPGVYPLRLLRAWSQAKTEDSLSISQDALAVMYYDSGKGYSSAKVGVEMEDYHVKSAKDVDDNRAISFVLPKVLHCSLLECKGMSFSCIHGRFR